MVATAKSASIKLVQKKAATIYLDELLSWLQDDYPEVLEDFMDMCDFETTTSLEEVK